MSLLRLVFFHVQSLVQLPDEGSNVAQSLEFFGCQAGHRRARDLVLRRRDHTVWMFVDDLRTRLESSQRFWFKFEIENSAAVLSITSLVEAKHVCTGCPSQQVSDMGWVLGLTLIICTLYSLLIMADPLSARFCLGS